MFPSTANGGNPFEPLFNRSYFLSDQIPSSEQVHNPPLLSSLPLPFFDEHELPLNRMLSQNQLVARKNLDTSDETTKNNRVGASTKSNEKEIDLKVAVAPLRRRNLGVIPRRRPGKKDRHSKICTAHGIRDRRMRLSLQVARKFFDLQDMLGFDKASKTIEWLFTNSKNAIKELKQTISDRKSESFLSDCEVASDIEDSPRNDVRESSTPADAMALCIEQNETKFDQKNACKSYMKESRDKARARARSRTREKMLIKLAEDSGPGYKPTPGHDYYLETLGFPNSPTGGVDQASSSQKRVSPYEDVYHPIEHQLSDVDTTEKLLGNSRSSALVSSSWPISDHKSSDAVAASGYINSNCDFFGFLGNWDLLSCDSISSSQYAVADQVSGQGYNLYSLYSTTPDFQ